MKIIDILNKIANSEEVPKEIKYDARIMEYDYNKQDYNGYYSNGKGNWLFQYLFDKCRDTKHFINDEVEIIEEPKELKELKEIKTTGDEFYCEYIGSWIKKEASAAYCEYLSNKINEIIRHIKDKENK